MHRDINYRKEKIGHVRRQHGEEGKRGEKKGSKLQKLNKKQQGQYIERTELCKQCENKDTKLKQKAASGQAWGQDKQNYWIKEQQKFDEKPAERDNERGDT